MINNQNKKLSKLKEIKQNSRLTLLFLKNDNNDLLSESADPVKSVDVLQKIKNDMWEGPNNSVSHSGVFGNREVAIKFFNSIQPANTSSSATKHSGMLTIYSIDDLMKMKLYKVVGYNIGFALKIKGNQYSELVSVHNNEPNVKGVGDELIQSAIKHGACYLDHFSGPLGSEGKLDTLYSKYGFEEYQRDKYDSQYDDKTQTLGKTYQFPDVIYRKRRGCD